MITEIRCSALARPMACAGFTALENLPVQPTNAAAEEGTACAELLERTLMGMDIPAQARNGVYFDREMKFYLKDVVANIQAKAMGAQVFAEQRIDWQTRSGIWIKGTLDTAFDDTQDTLYIDDLKYGWGIVEVKRNWQLIGYAIGELIRRKKAYPWIVMRIHQPRPHHEDGPTREWRISYAELLLLKEEIEQRMEILAAGVKDFQTGKHCKYCPASGEACPAFNRLFYRGLEVATAFVQDSITDQELGLQLDQANRAQEAIKIKMDSLKELAISRIKGGKILPGYVIESSYGDRKWKPVVSPEVVKNLTGIDIVEQVMLSPAKAEKAGVPKDFVAQLVDRYFLGPKLVQKDAGAIGDKIFGTQQPTRGG